MRIPFARLTAHQQRLGAHMLKFIPEWLVWAQAHGVAEAMIRLVNRNPDRYRDMQQERQPPGIDPETGTVQQRIQRSVGDRRLAVVALGRFAGVSLLLAMLGVYGVIGYTTKRRTQEIGIRMALGASASEVVRMVVREGMLMAALGILIGIGAALALTRLMEGILFGVGARDPLTFAVVTALIAAVTLLSTIVPARQAAHVEPVLALRAE